MSSADAEARANVANFFKEGHVDFTFGYLTDTEYERFIGELKKTNERISGQSAKNKQRGENTVIIAAFPQFKARKKRTHEGPQT